METSKQLSIFLDKPGRLANILAALAREKVNIAAMSVMDSHERTVLRLVLNEDQKTKQVLKSMSTPFTEADVLVVEMRNQPGALAHVCGLLAGEHINIDYCYCSAGGRNGKTMGIFKVSNTEKAMRVLNEQGSVNNRKKLQLRPMRDRRSFQPR